MVGQSEVSYWVTLTDHVVGQSEVSYWVTLTDQMVSQSESQPLIDSSHWVARRLTNDQSYSQSIKPVKSPRYLTFHLISQFAGIMNNHIVSHVGQSLGRLLVESIGLISTAVWLGPSINNIPR